MKRVGQATICQVCYPHFATSLFSTASRAQTVGVSEFVARRRRLLSCLDSNTLIIILASDEVTYSQDIMYPHRQNSLFYHLFGLQEPMRRTLIPSTSAFTSDLRLTCGAFMKTDRGSQTFLFVPPQTTDPAELVWASQPKTLEDFRRIHLGLCEKEEQNDVTTENHKDTVRSSSWSENVHLNDIKTIASVLYKEIQASAQCRWTSIVDKHDGPLDYDNMENNRVRLLYKALDPLPQLLVEFPPQLRWTGQQYRLEASWNRTMVKDSTKNGSIPPVSVTFKHPFEALMGVLLAFHFRLAPPPTSLTSPRRMGFPTLECAYHLPGGSQGGCGALPNDHARQERIRRCLALPGSANGVPDAAARGVVRRCAIRSAEDPLRRYRLFKSPGQIAQHLRSAAATRQAFHAAMRRAARTNSEHAIAVAFHRAILDLSERMGPGARVRAAYVPVVASGVRATEIHYTGNDRHADVGELLRLDGGVEVELVPTDCTRTFPVCQPSFTTAQKRVYDALLQVQRGILQDMESGLLISKVAKKHVESTRKELEERLGVHGVTQGQVRSLFCAHCFGHLMGLDIHESFVTQSKDMKGRGLTFGGGMVHTVEPGMYFPDVNRATAFNYDLSCVPQALRGVGLQIEDDVLILPCCGGSAEEQSPWSCQDYLNQALRTTEELLEDEDYISDCVFFREEKLQRYRVELTSSQFSALYFLFLQRASLFGLPEAIECLSLDAARVQTHFTERKPIAEWVPPSCGWYPFKVVVLTACIPKEVPHIEGYMK